MNELYEIAMAEGWRIADVSSISPTAPFALVSPKGYSFCDGKPAPQYAIQCRETKERAWEDLPLSLEVIKTGFVK